MSQTQKAVQRTELEQIQEDAKSPSVQVERKPDVNGAAQLHSELEDMADSFDATGFKCVHEDCGLVHGHDSTKHRASDDSSMDISEEEAAQMEFNPNCHCGLNELARSGADGAPTASRANSMAPIPDSASRSMDRML